MNSQPALSAPAQRTLVASFLVAAVVGAGAWYFSRPAIINNNVASPRHANAAVTTVPTATSVPLPTIENNAFAAGEKLRFNIIFKGVTVGHAVIEIKDGPLINNRPTLRYASTTKSTKFFDPFFKVRDENTSTVDKASLHSVAFDQDLHEGRYRAVRHYTFDYHQRKFTSSEQGKNKANEKQGPIETPLHDVLSALYFTRTQKLAPGDKFTLTIFRNGTGTKLPVKVDTEPQILKTNLGKISCVRVEPQIQGDALFKTKDNKLVVWMTNDERKLPVLIEASIPYGLVRIKLDDSEKPPR